MTFQHILKNAADKRNRNFAVSVCIAMFILANVLLDFLFSRHQNSSFYISESLLFSSYWLLYFPGLNLLVRIAGKTDDPGAGLRLTGAAIVIHLLAYPVLIWVLSKMLFSHTFEFWQTLNYGLSAYSIKTVLIYGFWFVTTTLLAQDAAAVLKESIQKKAVLNESILEEPIQEEAVPGRLIECESVREEQSKRRDVLSSLMVSDINGKKLLLPVADILYFSANAPYINIHCAQRKFLHTETLKSLETQLDDSHFIRIHKSHIVNVEKVSVIQSRHNGDYDVTLCDGATLRVSRNYAKHFKSLVQRVLSLPRD